MTEVNACAGSQWRASVQMCLLQQGVHSVQHSQNSYSPTFRRKTVQGTSAFMFCLCRFCHRRSHLQWRRQDLLRGGAKLEIMSWGTHSGLKGRPGAADCSITNSFVTNAVLIERALSCWYLHHAGLAYRSCATSVARVTFNKALPWNPWAPIVLRGREIPVPYGLLSVCLKPAPFISFEISPPGRACIQELCDQCGACYV